MAQQTDWVRINFRLPPDLHAQLRASALDGASSINAAAIRLLRAALTAEGTGETEVQDFDLIARYLASLGAEPNVDPLDALDFLRGTPMSGSMHLLIEALRAGLEDLPVDNRKDILARFQQRLLFSTTDDDATEVS